VAVAAICPLVQQHTKWHSTCVQRYRPFSRHTQLRPGFCTNDSHRRAAPPVDTPMSRERWGSRASGVPALIQTAFVWYALLGVAALIVIVLGPQFLRLALVNVAA